MIVDDQVYQTYIGLVMDRALHFHLSFRNVPLDELQLEGALILCGSAEKYDPSKAAFSTFLYVALHHGLEDFVRRWTKQIPPFYTQLEEIRDCPSYSYSSPSFNWRDFLKTSLKDLSTEAQDVLLLVLNTPEELCECFMTDPPKMVRGRIVKYLRDQGWSWDKIWKGMREAKAFMKEEGENGAN